MSVNKDVHCGTLSSEVHPQVPHGWKIESDLTSCSLTFTDVHVPASSNILINK